MDELLKNIATKKAELDRLRPLSTAALSQLQRYYDVELTYTSKRDRKHPETAEVIEHGISVGGKMLRDHLEAVITMKRCTGCARWPRPPPRSARILSLRAVSAGVYNSLSRRVAGRVS